MALCLCSVFKVRWGRSARRAAVCKRGRAALRQPTPLAGLFARFIAILPVTLFLSPKASLAVERDPIIEQALQAIQNYQPPASLLAPASTDAPELAQALTETDQRHRPLVSRRDGVFTLNPVFRAELGNLLQANHLAYALAYRYLWGQALLSKRSLGLRPADGWQLHLLQGKTGYVFGDVPGFLALHREKGVMIVALHGSILPGDWITNFDWRKADARLIDEGLHGTLHRGFAVKVKQLQSSLEEGLSKLILDLETADREKLLIFVTGHSHGAALAQLVVPVIARFWRTHVDASFDNSQANKIQVYRLAAPRCIGDDCAYNDLTKLIGPCNNIRQNASWDPVPNAIPGEAMMASLAMIGLGVGKPYWGHRSGGYLALQPSFPVVVRNWQAHTGKLRTLRDWASLFLNWLFNPHYVSLLKAGRGQGFDPSLVDQDIASLLARGYQHNLRKNQLKEAIVAQTDEETIEESTEACDELTEP